MKLIPKLQVPSSVNAVILRDPWWIVKDTKLRKNLICTNMDPFSYNVQGPYTLKNSTILHTSHLVKDTRCLARAWQCCCRSRGFGQASSPSCPQGCFHCRDQYLHYATMTDGHPQDDYWTHNSVTSSNTISCWQLRTLHNMTCVNACSSCYHNTHTSHLGL